MDKELKKIVAALEEQGFTVTPTKRGHLNVYKDGEWVTVFAGTPSDGRGVLNSIAAARRAGFRWKRK